MGTTRLIAAASFVNRNRGRLDLRASRFRNPTEGWKGGGGGRFEWDLDPEPRIPDRVLSLRRPAVFFTTFLSRFLGRFWRRAGGWRVLQASGPFLFYSGLGFTVAFRLLRVTQSAIGGASGIPPISEVEAHNCSF